MVESSKLGRPRRRRDYFESLPDEILTLILIRVPDTAIFRVAKLVCRKWHQMIHTPDFVRAHLNHSPPGLLLLEDRNNKPRSSWVSLSPDNNVGIYFSDFHYNSSFMSHFSFWSSCNGLLLESPKNDFQSLEIMNPVTRQRFPLPPIHRGSEWVKSQPPYQKSAIAYSPARNEYKVVRSYQPGVVRSSTHVLCAILTFRVDTSWRNVETGHLSLVDSFELCKWPFVTQGFVHWVEDRRITKPYHITSFTKLNMNYGFVLTRDHISVSGPYLLEIYNLEENILENRYFPSGNSCVSLVIGRGFLRWELWEMKPETGEWTRLPDISLEKDKDLINEWCYRNKSPPLPGDCKLCPVGWLKHREVILFDAYVPVPVEGSDSDSDYFFQPAKACVAFNFQKGLFTLFESDDANVIPAIHHRNSLVGII